MLEGQGGNITLIVNASASSGLENQNTTKWLSSRLEYVSGATPVTAERRPVMYRRV